MSGKLHLDVDKSKTLVVIPPRRVPIALKAKLKAELERLENLHVIQKVTGRTDWVSIFFIAEKPIGKLRVCIHPQHLDKALKRNHYPLLLIEEVLPELEGVKFIEGLSWVNAVADDVLVTGRGETYEEAVKNHDMNMLALLKRCQQKNIKLNKDKFKFKCEEVSFIGHTLTQNVLKIDPAKVEAITKMSKPKDVANKQLQYDTVTLEDMGDYTKKVAKKLQKLMFVPLLGGWTEALNEQIAQLTSPENRRNRQHHLFDQNEEDIALLKPFVHMDSSADLKQLHVRLLKDLDLVKMGQEDKDLMLLEDYEHFRAQPLSSRFNRLLMSELFPNLKVAFARILAAKPHSTSVGRLVNSNVALKSSGR
eukprot:gene1039-15368_t